jgi:N-acetylmuramoyl-L-alanine amidase
VRKRGYHVLRNAQCPAALIELGFVSNRTEEKLMMTAAWRQKVAKAIHASLIAWFQSTGRLPAAAGTIADAAPAKAPSQG